MNMKRTEIDNARLARLIERAENEKGTVLTRNGEPVAAILPYDLARCAVAVADRLKNRQEPFTQEALNAWLDDTLADLDVSEFMQSDL